MTYSTSITSKAINLPIPTSSCSRVPACEPELYPLTKVDDTAEGPVGIGERAQLLELTDQLVEPQLDLETRLALVEQVRQVLNHTENLATASDLRQTAIDTAA